MARRKDRVCHPFAIIFATSATRNVDESVTSSAPGTHAGRLSRTITRPLRHSPGVDHMARRFLLIVLAIGLVTSGLGARQGQVTADLLKGLELRSIGPALATGRIVDVEIDPKNPSVWYVATAFGGLWKTTNRGITFTPIFDDGGVVHAVLRGHRSEGLERHLARHRREHQPAQRALRRRRLQVDPTRARRGSGWASQTSEHIGQILDRSAQLERRLRRRAGPAVLGGRRARRIQDDRRRRDVDGESHDQRRHRRQRHRVRSEEPGHHVRLGLSAPPRRRSADRRRAGRRHLQDDQRRQDLDEAHEGAAGGRHGPRRARDRRPEDARDGLRADQREAAESGFFRSDDGGASWTRIGHMRPLDGAARRTRRRRRSNAPPPAPPAPCAPLGVARAAAPGAAGGSTDSPGTTAEIATAEKVDEATKRTPGCRPVRRPRQRAERRLLSRRRRAVLPRDLRRSLTAPTRSGR